ncbi:uncharacterized protein LOC108221534 isoform X1 [Daucus carota subsp. sativus]|uniref:uncharacterized protein LOC108221534 isoform X1 n=2 Tax=Daucus carota subsp. sativus TaxID=79200 RepID=UPI003082F40C
MFNIAMLKMIFTPHYHLHWIKAAGPYEIMTRWTVTMRFILLPWKPELIFTGTSVVGINPETHKFCSHEDSWDSINDNEYFSLEGVWDVIKQLWIYKSPDFDTPKFQILKRTATYEVRRYSPFTVVETDGEKLAGSTGVNAVASFPDPNQDISLRRVEGGTAAVLKFSGKPTEDIVSEQEKTLKSSLIRDGLIPKTGCLLVRYNDPGRTWSFRMVRLGLVLSDSLLVYQYSIPQSSDEEDLITNSNIAEHVSNANR